MPRRPGYWKNWRNHDTDARFSQLLEGTLAGSDAFANSFSDPFGG